MTKNWLAVNRKGLRQLLSDRPKHFVLTELIQNAWDEQTSRVEVTIDKPKGSRDARITVTDDSPDGFRDLAHTYEMFAESWKKGDATKRGRFNLGEKLVLALCREAEIVSTKGGYRFDDDGRHRLRRRTEAGTRFTATLPLTLAEYDECVNLTLQPPKGIVTIINGREITARAPLASTMATLATMIANEDGEMRRSRRQTRIDVLPASGSNGGMLFELGIPVVETGDSYDVDVQQRVPLNMERDNVPAPYLRDLRAEVVNLMAEAIDADQVHQPWVRDALADDRISSEAVGQIMRHRYGEKAVAYDPSDREANARATAAGYTVVHGSQMSASEWSQVRSAKALAPAGRVTPSARPKFSPDGKPMDVLAPDEYSEGMAAIVWFTETVAHRLIGGPVAVEVVRLWQPFGAFYGQRRLSFNLNRLGWKWFADGITDRVIDLVIHELGHEYESSHLSANYYRALTDLGARMTRLALSEPALFD